jgi:hypothetical protein
VLVAASQHDEVQLQRRPLVLVRTAAQALEAVFGDALGIRRRGRLRRWRRRELVDAFFRRAQAAAAPSTGRRSSAGPASRCATGRPLDDRYRLQFAAAARHSATPARSPCPAGGSTRSPRRSASVLTHLVQQCAGTDAVAGSDRAACRDAGAR